MSYTKKHFILILIIILTGCANPSQYKWYRYHISITTGLAEWIETDRGGISIKFAQGSDQNHLFSFSRLNQKIALSGNEIQIYGKLLPEVYHTPSGMGYTEAGEPFSYVTSEPFQYFVLKNWSIKVPIRISRRHEGNHGGLEILVEEKPRLTKEEFVSPIHTDPKVYEVH